MKFKSLSTDRILLRQRSEEERGKKNVPQEHSGFITEEIWNHPNRPFEGLKFAKKVAGWATIGITKTMLEQSEPKGSFPCNISTSLKTWRKGSQNMNMRQETNSLTWIPIALSNVSQILLITIPACMVPALLFPSFSGMLLSSRYWKKERPSQKSHTFLH